MRNHEIHSSISSGEERIIYYDEYDDEFLQFATELRTAQITPGEGTQTLYTGYSYNDWGGLASETKPLNQTQWNSSSEKQINTISYTYDSVFKFLASKSYYQDENTQLSISNDYDSTGRLTSTTNEKGETTEFSYDDSSHPGNLTETSIDLSGGRSSIAEYNYNDSSNTYAYPTSVTQYYTEDESTESSTTSNQYEYLFGNTLSRQDGEGNLTSYEYDSIGRMLKTTYPVSEGEDGQYTITDNYQYDLYIYPTEMPDRRLHRVINYRKQSIGGSTSMIQKQYNYYDDHGSLILSKDYDYENSSYIPNYYSYNEYGQLSAYEDDQGNITSYTSDEWNRLQSITDPQGNQQLYEYNNYDRTQSISFVPQDTGVAENHYTATYDQWGRTISAQGFPDGINQTPIETTYEYDLVGNLVASVDGRGNETTYTYDEMSRLIQVTDALGQDSDYEYDRLGNLIEVTQYEDTEEFITTKDYDERGLLTNYTEPEGEITTYTYNANGLPVEIVDASGKTTTMDYDGNNRLSQIAVGEEQIDYYYHPLGGVEKYDFTNGDDLYYDYYSTGLTSQRAVESYEVDFTYDTLGNRTQMTDPFGLAVNYQHDSLNRVTDIDVENKNFSYEYYGDGMIKALDYPNGLRAEYAYDNMNRLLTLINKLNGSTISQFSYVYDENSNIISVTENGQTTTYEYDALNRLTGINRPGGEEITYQYDSRGNRIQANVYEIDPSEFVPSEYEYNTWDELSEISTGGEICSFEYDPEGLRTVKETSEESIRYHCDDNGLVIAESDATDTVTAQNIWGHKPLARKIGSSYYYYIYNGHGDVIQVLDESGNTVNSYEYDEWGNILSKQETVDNPLKYCGEYYDDESGLYYLRARYYDPKVGRFVSKDPVEGDITNPLSLNRYAYCAGNPLIYVDPSGCLVTSGDEKHLSTTQCAELQKCVDRWDAAKARGDTDGMAQAHEDANNIRCSSTSGDYNVASDSGDGQGTWVSTPKNNGTVTSVSSYKNDDSSTPYILSKNKNRGSSNDSSGIDDLGTTLKSCREAFFVTWNDPNTLKAAGQTVTAVVTVVPAACVGAGAVGGCSREVIYAGKAVYDAGKLYVYANGLKIAEGTSVVVEVLFDDGTPPERWQGALKDGIINLIENI